MHIEEALTTYLIAQSGLTALIARRCFYDILPQGTDLPAVVCQCISDVKDHTHQGQVLLESPNYQFTVYASTRAIARSVAKQIKIALIDYVGKMSGLEIQYIKMKNELPSIDTTPDGTISPHTIDLEFEINYIKE